MNPAARRDLVHDLFLPTLLFAALGGMTWAVRGSSGYGAMAGCIFAGVTWGAAWWFIARDQGAEPTRRYTSAWIVLALTVGVGISGARGWMQWSSFFEGKLQTNYALGETVPISRGYGFLWLFIAGVPWAGIGACLLAWCGSLRETRAWHWALRLVCGIGAAILARYLFDTFPQFFLPLYGSLEARYQDLENNPNLRRLINDCGAAIMHLGLYLGLLGYELWRRDWKNVVLILNVGLINGAGWSVCQNWKWAPDVWPTAKFNWWRCWESSGGISIGIALGVAYFLVNRRMSTEELNLVRTRRSIERPSLEWLGVYTALALLVGWLVFEAWGALRILRGDAGLDLLLRTSLGWGLLYLAVVLLFGVAYWLVGGRRFEREAVAADQHRADPNLERFGLYLGMLLGLGLSVRSGLKGWFNIYRGDEEYWSGLLWQILGPTYLVLLVALCGWTLLRPLPGNYRGTIAPHAGLLIGLVLLVQNVLAQLITGPLTDWNEVAFSIYYLLLLAISVVIVLHYHALQNWDAFRPDAAASRAAG